MSHYKEERIRLKNARIDCLRIRTTVAVKKLDRFCGTLRDDLGIYKQQITVF